MKKLQGNAVGKLVAALLLLLMTFAGAIFGLKAFLAVPYLWTDSFQDTGEFYGLLYDRRDQIAEAFALKQQLDEENLTYMERQQLEDQLKKLEKSWASLATNFRFVVRNANGEEELSNLGEGNVLADQVPEVNYSYFVLGEHYTYDMSAAYYSQTVISSWDSAATESSTSSLLEGTPDVDQEAPVYTIECGVLSIGQSDAAIVNDEFSQLFQRYDQTTGLFSGRLIDAGVCLAAALAALLYLLWTAGHKAGEEGIVLTWQEKIFFDNYLVAMAAVGVAVFALGWYLLECYYNYVVSWPHMETEYVWLSAAVAAACALFAGIVTLTLRTYVVRLKAHALIRTTLMYRVWLWFWGLCGRVWRGSLKILRSFPFLWKVIAAFLVYFFVDLMLFTEARYSGLAGILWWMLNVAVLLLLCWWAMGFRRLRKGSQAIAAGDLEHQIDTHRMPHDLRCHAEDLNNISVGLVSAVDEKMKSERFKAELITNVSHDLKTPLTSIINYVDLLKTTEQTDPKALEYIEVLDRKSQRLKKLTEDLVEASKASTGVLTVNREKIGMVQLIDQALGEWKEKLEARKLTLVTALPEGETWVYADGRHLWRVIDNLLSNCAKYAMEGTRVYLELSRGHGQIVLSVKNISREALNIPPERLMERFVRGEESRTTDGSGLGLSIARSLTELQGGTFELVVDGDLFKALVTLPQAN